MAAKILPTVRQGVELRANISHWGYSVKRNRKFPYLGAPRCSVCQRNRSSR